MPNYYENNELQKILIAMSDKLQNKIISEAIANGLPYNNSPKVIKIDPSKKTDLSETESKDLLVKERHLLSGLPAPSEQMAAELFSNREEPIEFSYVLSHYVTVVVQGKKGSGEKDKTYYFNIDEANKYLSGRVFFRKVEITNDSKSIYTLKTNYTVVLEVGFTYFGNLLEECLVLTNINDPSDIINYAPIKLIYKYFDTIGLPSEDKSLRDSDGIFLNQELNLIDPARFSESISLGLSKIYKSYHLTYAKHEFDVFKSSEPINNFLENTLTITYIAYESDLERKLAPSSETPRTSDNLYALLKDAASIRNTIAGAAGATNLELDIWDIQRASQEYSEWKTVLDLANEDLSCALVYKSLKDDDPNKAALSAWSASSTPENIKQIRGRLSVIRGKMSDIFFRIDRTLITYILARCVVYETEIDSNLINAFEASNKLKKFEDNLLSVLGNTAAFVASAYMGNIVQAGISGIALASDLYEIIVAKTIVRHPQNITAIRSVAESGVNVKLAETFFNRTKRRSGELGFFTTGLLGMGVKGVASTAGALGIQWAERASNRISKNEALADAAGHNLEGVANQQLLGTSVGGDDETSAKIGILKKYLDNDFKLELPEEGSGDIQKIQFILFGDLLNIMLEASNNSTIVTGGKFIIDDPLLGTASYVNIMNTPILLSNLTKFLKERILDTNREMFYSTDLFIKECYESLLKNALSAANGFKEYENFFHSNIRMVHTIHKEGDDFNKVIAYTRFGLNTANNTQFKEFAKYLRKSQNILRKSGTSDTLQKIFMIGSEEEIKYFDFYQSYDRKIAGLKATTADPDKKAYYDSMLRRYSQTGPDSFQDYIIRENWIPCIPVQTTSRTDSIIKSKYLSFSKIDNPNITMGNIQGGLPIFRLPYSVKANFKIYLSFFLDIGSIFFVAPPDTMIFDDLGRVVAAENVSNTFGFGGLYVVNSSKLEYHFQRLEDNNITLPNEESKLSLGGYMLSWGDSLMKRPQESNKLIDKCKDLVPRIPGSEIPTGAGVATGAGSAAIDPAEAERLRRIREKDFAAAFEASFKGSSAR
jgi:hypothetical protein